MIGEVHGENTAACVDGTSEHWNVEPATLEENANVGVLLVVGFGGFDVMATATPTTGAAGVTVFDGAEAELVPSALDALTVKEYTRPLLRPARVALLLGAGTVRETPVGAAVTV